MIEEYIDRKISWNNISKLISYLEIKDTKLENLYKDAALHIKEFEDENYRLAYLRAKGKYKMKFLSVMIAYKRKRINTNIRNR